MLYAVAGGQSAGKTTALNALKQRGVKVIERKTSRSILEDWEVTLDEVNNNHELTIKFQEEILKRKINDEQEAVKSPDVWFTERTFADLHTYNVVALGKDNKYNNWVNEYYYKCVKAQRTYSCIFYITSGHFKPERDNVRGINEHYSRMVDLFMRDCTEKMSQNQVIIINAPNIEDRINIIQTQIASILTGINN